MADETIGRYKIEGLLGRGAMGVVYKAFDPVLDRHAAIKLMLTSGELDDELRARFFREARSAARLSNPNIISIYDMGEDSNRPFIAMEYVEGEDIKNVIKLRKFIPFAQKLQLIIQICKALAYAHTNGVIHRDIKPGNIRLTRFGEVKILDFGLARLESSEMTRTGMLMGTPYYMSPEQAKGARDIDGRSDLFSVGVILYELLSYHRPFGGDTPATVCYQIIREPHPPLSDYLPDCDPELQAIVDRALAKAPNDRFADGTEMASAIEKFLLSIPEKQAELKARIDNLENQIRRALQTGSPSEDDDGFEETATLPGTPQLATAEQSTLMAGLPEPDDYGILIGRVRDANQRLRLLEEHAKTVEELRVAQEEKDWERCLEILKEIPADLAASPEITRLQATCKKEIEQEKEKKLRGAEFDRALQTARQAWEQGLFEECIEAGRLALNIDQDHPEAVELVRLAEERLTRNRRLQGLRKVAEQALNIGNLSACLEAAGEGLALDPTNAELAGLREQALQGIERQAEIDRLLSEASSRYAKEDYPAVVATLTRLLQLDPDNTEAERLKGQAENAADRKERLETLTGQITEAKNRQDHRAVVELCSAALELDPENQALSQIRTEAEEALKKRASAEKLLRQAQKFYQQKNYEEASNLAGQAVEVDPELTEATRLQASAREALRQVEMESFLQRGTELFEQGHYQDAAEVCRVGLRLDAKDSRLLELTRQVEAALVRQAETRKILATAEEFLVAKRWAEAAEAANLILNMDPNNSRAIEIRELSSDQLDRAERLQILYERASRQRSAGAWQECLETCQEALRQAPEDTDFQALHAAAATEVEKGQKIASLLSAAQSAFRDSDLERALSLVGEAESLAGESNETRTLALKLQEAIDLRERVKERLEEAAKAFSAGEYQRAVELAGEGLSLQPSTPELKTIQSEAKKALERQEKVQGIVDTAGAALAKGQFDKASSLALSALQLDPQSSSARELLGKAEQLAEEAAREAKLKGFREAALKEFNNGAFQRSLELCGEGLLLSDDRDLKDLQLKSEQAIQERVAHIARLLEEGDKAFKSGHLEKAVQSAAGVFKIDPENPQAQELEKAARAAINEQERRARVKKLLTEARKARQDSNAQKCHRAATEALALDPGNAELTQLRQWASDLLEKERLEQERLSRIKESWDSARAALQRKRYRSAVRTLDLLLSLDSHNQEAKELREAALLAAAARRKQRIRFASYGAGAVLSISLVILGLWSASNLAWNGGQQVGAEPNVNVQTVVTPSAAPEMDGNSQLLEGLLSDARKHLNSKDFGQAAELATQALDLSEQHPDAQEILSQAKENLAAVEDGKQEVRSLIRQGRADQALTRLNQVLQLAPADPETAELSQQLDRQKDAKNTADAARREMALSKASAQKDATGLADLLSNAAAAETEADRLYGQGQFVQAAGKFYEARDGFDEAVREAAFREQQRIADGRRAVNQARDDFEQNRQRAEQAGAPDGAADLFRQANDLAVRAARKATGNDFAGARNDYQQATRLLSQAASSAAATRRRQEESQREEELTRQKAAAERNAQETAGRARQEAEDTLASLGDTAPAASQELSGAAALYGQGRWEEATAAYGRAISQLRAIQQDRSRAASALDAFISAYSSQDLRTLKSVWPTMDGSTEDQFKKSFADSRAIEIRFEPSSIRLDGDSATAIGSVFLKVTPIRGESMESGSESARFQLQRRGESWVIRSVQFNIGQ